jgi:hypothetical protein
MSPATIISVVLAAVAVYGAILSTLNHRAQAKVRRRAVNVRTTHGMSFSGPHISPPQIYLEAVNTGEVPVVLASFGFRLPDGKSLAMIDPSVRSVSSFPHELPPHRSITFGENYQVIAWTLAQAGYSGEVKLTGFYSDAEHREYCSKPWTLNVQDWLGGPSPG